MLDRIQLLNDLQPKTEIKITSKGGKVDIFKVVKFIPIQKFSNGKFHPVSDIEVLLNKKKNIFFSYNLYLEGKSWVQKIEVLK